MRTNADQRPTLSTQSAHFCPCQRAASHGENAVLTDMPLSEAVRMDWEAVN